MAKEIIYALNPSAHFDYEILDKYEAGIVLTGPEVKSIRDNRATLKAAYVRIMNGSEVVLLNCNISKYKPSFISQQNYDPERSRRLLLHKSEIRKLYSKVKEKGLTLIPLRIYGTKRMIKIEIALAKGKQQHDKREATKNREVARSISRAMKGDY